MFVIAYSIVGTCVLPLIAYIVRRRALGTLLLNAGVFFLVYALSALTQIALSHYSIQNHWVISITFALEFLTIGFMYRTWEPSSSWRKIDLVAMVLYAVLWILLKSTTEELNGVSPFSGPIAMLFTVLLSLRILTSMAQNYDRPLYTYPQFWIAFAILLSAAVDFFLMAVLPYVVTMSKADYFRFLVAHWAKLLIVNALFIFGLLWRQPTGTSGGSMLLEA